MNNTTPAATPGTAESVPDVRRRMRADLTIAIKARDRMAISALRSAIGALDNAEAIDVADALLSNESPIAGATSGLGSTEATRRALTDDDIARVIATEVGDRHTAAEQYDRAGQGERANALRAEAAVLVPYAR